jgi:hypothetical protein
MCEEFESEKEVEKVDGVVSAGVGAVVAEEARTQRLFDESVEKGEAKSAVRMMRVSDGLKVSMDQARPKP